MSRPSYIFAMLTALWISTAGCGNKNTGPDQTIAVPSAEWTISNHEPGNPNISEWTLTSKNGTKLQLSSFVSRNASQADLERISTLKHYMEEATKNAPMLSRWWTVEKYHVTRQYIPQSLSNIDHGSVNFWAALPQQDYVLTFTNPNLTQAEFIAYADKAVEDFAKANPK